MVTLYEAPSSGVWIDTWPGDEICVAPVPVLSATGHPVPTDGANYACGHRLPCPKHP